MDYNLQKDIISKKIRSEGGGDYDHYLSEKDFPKKYNISIDIIKKALEELKLETSGKVKILWFGKTNNDISIYNKKSVLAKDISNGLFYNIIKYATEWGIPEVEIYYDNRLCVGQINNDKFKIKPNSPAAKLFSLLHGGMNQPIDRYSVLVCCDFYKEGDKQDPTKKGDETSRINDIVKTIRRTLKLGKGVGTEVLQNNGGTLVLIGKKLKIPKVIKLHQK